MGYLLSCSKLCNYETRRTTVDDKQAKLEELWHVHYYVVVYSLLCYGILLITMRIIWYIPDYG